MSRRGSVPTVPGWLAALGWLAVLGGLAALAITTSAGAQGPTARRSAASHLQVTQVEYRLELSRGVVRAGPVALEAIDRGMDPHDLRLRRVGSTQEVIAPELQPGRRWDRVVALRPGVYHLWCSLPEHAGLGMRATLRVVR